MLTSNPTNDSIGTGQYHDSTSDYRSVRRYSTNICLEMSYKSVFIVVPDLYGSVLAGCRYPPPISAVTTTRGEGLTASLALRLHDPLVCLALHIHIPDTH